MKTEFTKLPKGAQEFINREGLGCYFFDGEISLKMLHTLKEWSKATDEERLAYAYWKYPRGVKFIDQETNGALTSAGESFSIAWFYDFKTHKWAEIIEEEEEPTFKAGDEVDHKFVNTGWLSEKAIFTGGFNTKGNPIVEINGDLHVVKEIRKPDPDKVYREIAKEMIKSNNLMVTSQDNFIHGLTADNLYQMLIEAIKKGKEL